jgi:putative membrane protein
MFLPHHEPSQFGYLFAILGGLSWLAIVAGIVLLVIWAVRAMPRTAAMAGGPAAVESPEDILARRFAMGEITAEEYERSRDLLRGDTAKP